MKSKFLLSTFFLMFQLSAFSQPTIQWQKSLGGTGEDYAYSIQQTTDGGYVVAGFSYSNNGDVTGHHGSTDSTDYWIVKLDGNGNIQWQKSLGGSGNETAYSIQQTTDGGYIVAGYSTSTNGDVTGHSPGYSGDCWIVKLSDVGVVQWQECLGGQGDDIAFSIKQTIDGGYIVAGSSPGVHGGIDYWIVKLSNTGIIEWLRYLGGSALDHAYSIQQTTDSGYIVAGQSRSTDGDVTGHHGASTTPDYWIVKLSSAGDIQWQKSLGGYSGDVAYSIQQTTDGGYIVAGYAGSNDGDITGNHGYADYWVVKLSNTGVIQWQKSLGGSNSETGYSIQQTTDGGYIVAGNTASNNGDVLGYPGGGDYYWIVKLSSIGDIQWQKLLGGTQFDYARSIQQTTDGGYIVAGISASTDGDVTGHHGTGYNNDYWVVKLSAITGLDDNIANKNSLRVYPNPLTSSSTLHLNTQLKDAEVVIYDMLGKEMVRKKLTGDRIEIERGSLESGVYFVRVREGERRWVEKVIIQ